MNRQTLPLAGLCLLAAALAACALPHYAPMPTPSPFILPSPTASEIPTAGPTAIPPTPTLAPPTPTIVTPVVSTAIPAQPPAITPGAVSGPYAVVLVLPNDVLNIRSGPGVENRIVGAMAYNEIDITRTGPSARVGDSIWWEIQSRAGTRGWANSAYLTEYVAPSDVCDPNALTLLDDLKRAVMNEDGVLLASLVSPRHGLEVWLWRSGRPINFDAEHARWVFDSAYVHNWGAHPASGLDTHGTFRQAVLPYLKDMYTGGLETRCNERGVPGWNIDAWPEQYRNVNVYKLYKPGAPGVELDYRIWLAGVEYVGGKPYLFALIHFIWTP